MPILNSRGDALAGIDGIVSVNGLPVSALANIPAGGWRWLTNDIIAGQAYIGGAWSLWQVDLRSNQELKMLDGIGANEFRAGANQWLAYIFDDTGAHVRGTIPKAIGDGRALYDVGRDGVAVVKDDQASGAGVRVVTAIDERVYPTDTFIAYQDGHLLSVTATGLAVTHVATWSSTVIPDLGVRGGRICVGHDGVIYHVFYWRGYTVVQRLGGYTGWPIRFSEFDFNPDVVAFDADTLIVTTSQGQGERPEQTQKYDIDLTVAPVDLRNLYPPVIMPPVSDVAAIGRNTFIGPYQFNTFYGRRR